MVGDLVEVRSGEVIPVDGTITKGSGSIDKAPLTGEPVPIPVSEGDKVQAGLGPSEGPDSCELRSDGGKYQALRTNRNG